MESVSGQALRCRRHHHCHFRQSKERPKIAIVNSKLVPAKSNASVVATSIQVEFHSSTNTNRTRARAGTRVSTTKANPKVVPRLCPRVLLSLRAANQTGMPVSSRSKIRTRSNKVTSLMAVAVAPRFHLQVSSSGQHTTAIKGKQMIRCLVTVQDNHVQAVYFLKFHETQGVLTHQEPFVLRIASNSPLYTMKTRHQSGTKPRRARGARNLIPAPRLN